MFNPVQFQNDATAAAAVTLGYAPGNTIPPQLLVLSSAAGFTVTLPPINPTLNTPPTTSQPVTVGVGGGYRITIYARTAQSYTIAPATTADTMIASVTVMSATATSISYQASPLLGGWVQTQILG